MPLLSDSMSTLLTICSNSAELALHPAIIFISAFNFALIFNIGCVHRALRFILICQSANIILFEFFRLILTAQRFIQADPFAFGLLEIRAFSLFTGMFRNSIGHVLFLERLFATIFVRKYESIKKRYFCFVWFPILNFWCGINAFEYWIGTNTATFVFYMNLVAIILCSAEILAIFLLGTYNMRKYSSIVPNIHSYTLTEKYQLAENIRTSRQLAIVYFCHFLNNLIFCILNGLNYFVNDIHILMPIFGLLINSQSIVDAAIEITVITHHPILKKKACFWLKKMNFLNFFHWRNNKIELANIGGNSGNGGVNCANLPDIQNLHGESLKNPINKERYLQMIEAAWK